jgi:hypothetical protein
MRDPITGNAGANPHERHLMWYDFFVESHRIVMQRWPAGPSLATAIVCERMGELEVACRFPSR